MSLPKSNYLSILLNSVLPSVCVLCKDHVSSSNTCLCNRCINKLPWISNHCSVCGCQLETTQLCPQCQQSPPYYRRCISAFNYSGDSIDRLIFPIKKDPVCPQLRQLTLLMSKTIKRAYSEQELPTVLVPVPVHWRTLLHRGFNQSHSIAHQLTRCFDNLELATKLCQRLNYSTPQRLRNRQQRLSNMKHSFSLDPTVDAKESMLPRQYPQITNKTLAIVDDVVTTGATVNALAKLLIEAGAKQVDVWAIAKTNWHI